MNEMTVQTHRWRYCTSYFPSTSFPGNGSSSAGVSAVLGVGFAGAEDSDGMSMGRTNDRRRAAARRTRLVTKTKVFKLESVPPDRGQIGPPPPASTSPIHRSTMGELDGRAGNGLVSEYTSEVVRLQRADVREKG
jgi:hypothetical protein